MAVYVKDSDGNRVKIAGLGAQGPAGKSAYRYAAEGGFSGSEDEFRALMGVRSNPNLLHNAYWAQKDYIINQRGQEEYTAGGYTIDRWMALGGLIVTLEDGWIKLYNPNTEGNAFFGQEEEISEYDSLVGSQCTISALYKCDNPRCAIYGCAGNADGSTIDVTLPGVNLESDEQPHVMSITSGVIQPLTMARWRHFFVLVPPGATAWLKAAKLELGPVQTLAHQDAEGNWALNDPPPDKALELAKCQRELFVLDTAPGVAISTAVSDSNGIVGLPITVPVVMRAVPAVSVTGTLRVHKPGVTAYSPVDSFSVEAQGNIVNILVRGLNANTTYTLDAYPAGKIIFDANL